MPAGRPTKYRPEFCELVIKDGEQGLSLTAFAGGIGIDRSTVNEWMSVHPEFSQAVKRHGAARTRYLEQTLLSESQGPRVTARIFALKNAAPDEWRDIVEQKITMRDERVEELDDDTLAHIAGAGRDGAASKANGKARPDRVH